MQTKAYAKSIKISAKKVRLVADVVRNAKVNDALAQLKFMNKGAARPVAKLINSVVANAEHNFELDKDNLYIKEILVNEAQTLKRSRPRAHGRATTIRKRGSHITVTVAEIKDSGDKKSKKQAIDAPVSLGAMTNDSKKKTEAKKGNEKKDSDAITDNQSTVNNPAVGKKGSTEGGNKGFASKIFRRKSG